MEFVLVAIYLTNNQPRVLLSYSQCNCLKNHNQFILWPIPSIINDTSSTSGEKNSADSSQSLLGNKGLKWKKGLNAFSRLVMG